MVVRAALLLGLLLGAPLQWPPTPTPDAKVTRVSTGAAFTIGPVRYTVKQFTTRTYLGSPWRRDYPPPAGSIYMTIWYTAENIGDDTITARANPFYLRDGKGRRFTVNWSTQSLMAMLSWRDVEIDLQLSELPPGVVRHLLAGFLLPTDALTEALRLFFPVGYDGSAFIEVHP